jgi:hypothetical protein
MFRLGFMRPRDTDGDGFYDRKGGKGDASTSPPTRPRTAATGTADCSHTSRAPRAASRRRSYAPGGPPSTSSRTRSSSSCVPGGRDLGARRWPRCVAEVRRQLPRTRVPMRRVQSARCCSRGTGVRNRKRVAADRHGSRAAPPRLHQHASRAPLVNEADGGSSPASTLCSGHVAGTRSPSRAAAFACLRACRRLNRDTRIGRRAAPRAESAAPRRQQERGRAAPPHRCGNEAGADLAQPNAYVSW